MAKGITSGKMAILVGGGPVPGINGVIGAATIDCINQGFRVVGLRDGYKWLSRGNVDGEAYECACHYVIRLERDDFAHPEQLQHLAESVSMAPEQFRRRFGYVAENCKP